MNPHVPMQRVRDAAARAVARGSLRSVAREVGMSAPGLQHFLGGGEPRKHTARKLREWHVRDAATRREVDADTAALALALLLDGVPDSWFLPMRARVRDLIRDLHRQSGVEPPAWAERIVP